MSLEPLDRAFDLCGEAAQLLEADHVEEAERRYLEALSIDDRIGPAWFDLALIAKRRRDWVRMRECSERAAEAPIQLPGDHAPDPAWWNLGIAATALGDWGTARRAWAAYGLTLPPGDGEIRDNFGSAPIRLDPTGEVVWAQRIDPCRAQIWNVPMPDSGHRWRDVVLNDGVPHGERIVEGTSHPVFDELERLEDSGIPTLALVLDRTEMEDRRILIEGVQAQGYGAEDWSRSVRILCETCSEGQVDATHNHEQKPLVEIGLAGDHDSISDIVETWFKQDPVQRTVRSLSQVL